MADTDRVVGYVFRVSIDCLDHGNTEAEAEIVLAAEALEQVKAGGAKLAYIEDFNVIFLSPIHDPRALVRAIDIGIHSGEVRPSGSSLN